MQVCGTVFVRSPVPSDRARSKEVEVRRTDCHEVLCHVTLLKFVGMFQLPLKRDDSNGQ
jgi:hypothetical protein